MDYVRGGETHAVHLNAENCVVRPAPSASPEAPTNDASPADSDATLQPAAAQLSQPQRDAADNAQVPALQEQASLALQQQQQQQQQAANGTVLGGAAAPADAAAAAAALPGGRRSNAAGAVPSQQLPTQFEQLQRQQATATDSAAAHPGTAQAQPAADSPPAGKGSASKAQDKPGKRSSAPRQKAADASSDAPDDKNAVVKRGEEIIVKTHSGSYDVLVLWTRKGSTRGASAI